ncbi:hypothetical protein FEK46_22170 [Escherichia sp. E4736]|nr:hypothetical protein FEK66_22390 [Escherichia sp. E1130]TLI89074.1 hypothetical protein FEK46_22170 [Escherichia sp. E4736]
MLSLACRLAVIVESFKLLDYYASIIAGITFGYRLWRSQPPLKNTDNPGMIIMASNRHPAPQPAFSACIHGACNACFVGNELVKKGC